MRIQETNDILNEARVLRRAHSQETGEFRNANRMRAFKNAMRSRSVQAGIVGGLAAIGVGLFLMNRRSRLDFDFR
jgi:hypothetical protein